MTRLALYILLSLLFAASISKARVYDLTSHAAWTLKASRTRNINPLDRPDDVQQQQKNVSVQLSFSKKADSLRAKISNVRINVRMNDLDVDPIGKDALEHVELNIPLGSAQGVTSPVPTGDMDATSWPAIEPMAEFLAQLLQLCLPPVPPGGLQKGSYWSTGGKIEAALEGAPGVTIDVYIFSFVGDTQSCNGGTCVLLSQIVHVSSFERRPMGNSILGIDLEGTGVVTTMIRLEDHSLLSSTGYLNLESDTISHLALGMPPVYAMHTSSQTSFQFYPSEDSSTRR